MEHVSKLINDYLKDRRVNPQTGLPDSRPASIEPNCPICRDKGWVHVKGDYSTYERCKCKADLDRRERQTRLLKYCRLPERTEHKTFANFRTFDLPVLIEAKRLAETIGSDEIAFLTLLAESDRGKSHLGVAACRQWIAEGRAAKYVEVAWLLGELRHGFEMEGEEAYWPRLNLYCQVGLLVMDDLGVERITEWGAEQIQTIINYRYDHALPLIVTSNRPIDDLFDYADHRTEGWRDYANMRVGSRLQRESWCKVLVLDTPEYSDLKGSRNL